MRIDDTTMWSSIPYAAFEITYMPSTASFNVCRSLATVACIESDRRSIAASPATTSRVIFSAAIAAPAFIVATISGLAADAVAR